MRSFDSCLLHQFLGGRHCVRIGIRLFVAGWLAVLGTVRKSKILYLVKSSPRGGVRISRAQLLRLSTRIGRVGCAAYAKADNCDCCCQPPDIGHLTEFQDGILLRGSTGVCDNHTMPNSSM